MAPLLGIYVVPVIIILLVIEMVHSYKEEKQLFNRKNTISNLLVGAGYFVSTVASKAIMFFIFQWAYTHKLFNFSNNWLTWILAFIAADFSYYIYHRVSHEVNWFWASHVVHHSSEEFNLSVAFRLPWLTHLTGYFAFWIWMPFLGFSPYITTLAIQACFLYQAFLHTKVIGKLHPVVEYIFNTPSHHRVHHSSNLEYLDKNHSGVLIIWDRLFGTYAEEKTTPVYGLTTKLESNNPVVIVFHEWKDILQKAKKAGSLKNAINYFIKSPGWSHDGSTQTVSQLRKEVKQPKKGCKAANNCAACGRCKLVALKMANV